MVYLKLCKPFTENGTVITAHAKSTHQFLSQLLLTIKLIIMVVYINDGTVSPILDVFTNIVIDTFLPITDI